MKPTTEPDRRTALLAGIAYAIIIICGIWAEGFVRAPLRGAADAETLVVMLREHEIAVRFSILADAIMALSDVALAVLLYFLLRVIDPLMALGAMVFRLVQAAILGVNLGNPLAALALASSADAPAIALQAASLFEAHATGYDLGLLFFGVNCLLTGELVRRSGFLPRWLGLAVSAAGIVYLAGSTVRIVAPQAVDAVAVAYALPLFAETAFCLALLWLGWPKRQSAAG